MNNTQTPQQIYNSLLQQYNDANNSYYNNQLSQQQKVHDAQSNYLNTNNTYALGTQSGDARNSFLNSVASPDESNQGRLEYDYNRNTAQENGTYNLNSLANTQNRDLALSKLATQEQYANQALGLKQGIDNQTQIEDLNKRGLLTGQAPTGGYQAQAIGGLSGLAGQQAGLTNQNYANQFGNLTDTYGQNVLGANQDYSQTQNMQNLNHNYQLNDIATTARRNTQDQNANFTNQMATNDNALQAYKNQLANQKSQANVQSQINASQKAYLGY